MNFPLAIFPTAVSSVALLIPLSAGMDAMRQVLFRSTGVLDVGWEIALLAVESVVFLWMARRGLRMLERRAREEGTLTVRWQ